MAYDVNKLQTVANGINSNTNLDLWRDAELEMMPILSISDLFSISSNVKMPIMQTLCISTEACNLEIALSYSH